MKHWQFIVICRTDRIGRRKGPYVLATRQLFASREQAEQYASTIAKAREPVVVEGRFRDLRFIVSEVTPNDAATPRMGQR